ncbi:MAG: uncharacterized protein JWL66_850 [Sphingomonadales bacterium]|nr:uncharacterized protein [Sphingomonadales bacterium]
MLAATIDFEFELEPVTFVQRRHASTFHCRNVDECVGLSIVALNEAEAFHRVEELDRSAGLFTGQLALWCATETAASATSTAARGRSRITVAWRTAIGDGHGLAVDLEVGCRDTTATIDESEAKWLTLGKTSKSGLLDCRNVHEHVLSAIIANDEAETLLSVKELYDAGAFTDDLGRHAATSAATGTAASETATAAAAKPAAAVAAAKAIAAAAAEAITATAAAAETVAAASKSAAVAAAAAAFIAAETVALVASASAAFTATTSIETHALPYSFA